jgi:type IV pilus assembly protein PilM
VAIAFNINPFQANAELRPRLACEITPEGVIAARGAQSTAEALSFAPLPQGALLAGLKTPNLADPQAVSAALERALTETGTRERALTVVIPDAAARVLLLEFDNFPTKIQEALPIVRFRLRKLLPFEADQAAVSYQVLSRNEEQVRVLAVAMPSAVLTEYEDAVRAAKYEPGAVLPSTLASLAALPTDEAACLVLHCNGLFVTTAITRGNELLLHRTQELPPDEGAFREMAEIVSVAMAYFEDTLHLAPGTVYYSGPGGAVEFARAFGSIFEEPMPRIRDLAPTPATGMTGTIPKGLVAGVTGALAS